MAFSTYNLVRLWRITGDERWQQLAEQQFAAFKTVLQDYPPGYTSFIQAIQFYLSKGEEIVLTGQLDTKEMEDMQAVIFEEFRPYLVLIYNEGTVGKVIPRMNNYPIPGADPNSDAQAVKAYLCRNFACQEPVNKPEQLKALLQQL